MNRRLISQNSSLRIALEKLNNLSSALMLCVIDSAKRIVGTITDGDIRRAITSGRELTDPVTCCMNKNFRYFRQGEFSSEQLKLLHEKSLRMIPVVDKDFKVVKLIELQENKNYLPLDAVLMAGGEGRRLRPLTAQTPKPLLKIGNKPIIQHNLDRLESFGIENFFICIRYMGSQLVQRLGKTKTSVNYEFVREEKPLGTIGAVRNIESFKNDFVLLMNSDLITDVDVEDFFRFFLESRADLAVAAVPYEVNVPYAVLGTKDNEIVSIKEKPSYTFYSNAGIYLFKKNLVSHIPKDTFYDATEFVDQLIQGYAKVVHYPLSGYWMDIGTPVDYREAQKKQDYIKRDFLALKQKRVREV